MAHVIPGITCQDMSVCRGEREIVIERFAGLLGLVCPPDTDEMLHSESGSHSNARGARWYSLRCSSSRVTSYYPYCFYQTVTKGLFPVTKQPWINCVAKRLPEKMQGITLENV